MTPEQESTEDWLGHNVQDTIEHSLGVGRNDIATLRQSPSNRVEKPEKGGPSTDDEVGPAHIRANVGSMLATGPDEGPRDPKEGEASEGVVPPLYDR